MSSEEQPGLVISDLDEDSFHFHSLFPFPRCFGASIEYLLLVGVSWVLTCGVTGAFCCGMKGLGRDKFKIDPSVTVPPRIPFNLH